MAQYYAILTKLGAALMANAALSGGKINVTEFALGDGGGSFYLPAETMTELRHEVWRTAVSHGEISEESPNRLDFYAVVPPEVGGFTIREMGLFDAQNRLIGVANTPDIQKVAFADGVSYDSLLSISLAVVSPETLEYKVDPYVIIATKKDIETHNASGTAHEDIRNTLSGHMLAKGNPHAVTAAQVGAPTLASFNSLNTGYTAHAAHKANPHGVTAAQAGAPTLAEFNTHKDSKTNPHAVTAAQVGAPTLASFNTLNTSYTTHAASKANPHGVTAAQAGAYTKAEADALLSNKANKLPNHIATLDFGVVEGVEQLWGGFFKDDMGWVHVFQSYFNSSTSIPATIWKIIANLPAGFRPPMVTNLYGLAQSDTTEVPMECQVRANGEVAVKLFPAVTGGGGMKKMSICGAFITGSL